MHKFLTSVIAIASLLTLGAAPDFEAGQVWAYKTRPGEEESTLLINKVEDDPRLGQIYHISISKVRLSGNTLTLSSELPHLPVSLQTLRLSCTTLIRQSDPNPMYLPGYRLWRQAFDTGRAGIYTISIADILDLTEKMLQKQATAT